ncbi:aminoglycoside phosphotransferase family protein [Streptomyces sp. AC550_RSS872]|uniref:phosphotransferase family protein n=1 Tax=Streptomyces sp. AC550_RSS872 TaxID=2823689 RepID=UPI0027E522E3|nr:aminoglycoside phosphotransferase family protein [Streptomyces sp. AC550_RSS872]
MIGHHNMNHIRPLGQPLALLLGERSGQVRAKFRTPFETIEVVPRIWPRESEILRVVGSRLPDAPRCLADFGVWSLDTLVKGRVLSDVVPEGTVGADRLAALADFFVTLSDVPKEELPGLPADWPEDGDSLGFLHWLAGFAADRVYQANLPRFGALFDAVGVPGDAMERFLNATPPLTRRPFALLHTDVHRANIVLSPRRDGERLVVIDWETAMYGDPLHELATHLVRMQYGKTEKDLMVGLWAEAMRRAGHGEMAAGLERDLPSYLGFELAQSVFPDVMRAALRLPDQPTDRDFAEAAERVCRALWRAREPLRLEERPVDEDVVRQALRRWQASDDRVALVKGRGKGVRGWDDSRRRKRRGGSPGAGLLNGMIGALLLTRMTVMPR